MQSGGTRQTVDGAKIKENRGDSTHQITSPGPAGQNTRRFEKPGRLSAQGHTARPSWAKDKETGEERDPPKREKKKREEREEDAA